MTHVPMWPRKHAILGRHVSGKASCCTFVLQCLVAEHVGAGTLTYMAPELLSGSSMANKITDKVDIYSLGIMLWEMATRTTPWKGYSDVQIQAMVRGAHGMGHACMHVLTNRSHIPMPCMCAYGLHVHGMCVSAGHIRPAPSHPRLRPTGLHVCITRQ